MDLQPRVKALLLAQCLPAATMPVKPGSCVAARARQRRLHLTSMICTRRSAWRCATPASAHSPFYSLKGCVCALPGARGRHSPWTGTICIRRSTWRWATHASVAWIRPSPQLGPQMHRCAPHCEWESSSFASEGRACRAGMAHVLASLPQRQGSSAQGWLLHTQTDSLSCRCCLCCMQVSLAGKAGPASSSRVGASHAKHAGPGTAQSLPFPVLLARTAHQMLVEQVMRRLPLFTLQTSLQTPFIQSSARPSCSLSI